MRARVQVTQSLPLDWVALLAPRLVVAQVFLAERGYGPVPTTAARAAPSSPMPTAASVVPPAATIDPAAADAVLGLGGDFLD